jgi:hypothetical protein
VAKYQSKLKTALSTNFYGGKKGMKNRISSIMDAGKKKVGAAIVCMALITTVGTGFAFAANAAQSAPMAVTDTTTDPYPYSDRFAVYAEYGLDYDNTTDRLFYKGELVRYFEDWFPVDDNSYAGQDYFNENGTVDIHGVRDMSQVIYYADGGYDPSGKLIGVELYSQAEFDARDVDKLISPVQNSAQSENMSDSGAQPNGATGQTIGQASESGPQLTPDEYVKMYSVYEPFGVTYDKVKDRFYYNGKLVRSFQDIQMSNGESLSGGRFQGSMMSRNEEDGEIDIETVRDFTVLDENGYGKLTGIKVVTD